MRFTRDFPFVFVCPASRNRRKAAPCPNRATTPRKAAQLRALKRPFYLFLSRVHSCTIRLISLFPMTKNARYGRINFRGRLAQRERRCLTSIGSGVQIPHRPPFERTMAAHLSSHFLFLHYLKLRYQFNFNAFARVTMHHNLHYKSHHAAHKHYFSSSIFSLSLPQAHTEGGKPCQMSN